MIDQISSSFHYGSIVSMDTAISKPLLITAGEDRSIIAWNYVSNSVECSQVYDEAPTSVSIHPNGLYAAATFSLCVKLMSIYADEMKTFWETPTVGCKQVKFSNGGQFYAVLTSVNVLIYNFWRMERVCVLDVLNARIKELIWKKDDSQLITYTSDGLIQCWNGHDFSIVFELNLNVMIRNVHCGSEPRKIVILLDNGTLVETSNGEAVTIFDSTSNYNNMNASSYAGIVVSTNAGAVRAYSNSSSFCGDFKEYSYSSHGIERLIFSKNGRHLISAGNDGTIWIHKVTGFDAACQNAGKWEYSEEILVQRVTAKELDKRADFMHEKLKAEQLVASQKQLQREALYEQNITDLQAQHSMKIDMLRSEILNLAKDVIDSKNDNEKQLSTLKLDNENDKNDLIKVHLEKMSFEQKKYVAIQETNVFRETQWKGRQDIIETTFEVEKTAITERFERTMDNMIAEMASLKERALLHTLTFEKEMKILDDLVEKEVFDLACVHEPKIQEENARYPQVNREHSEINTSMANRLNQLAQIKGEICTLDAENLRIQFDITALDRDLLELKAEIKDRDETITAKDQQILEWKKSNQELEKYKFVTEFQFMELRKQDESRGKECASTKRQLQEMKKELGELHGIRGGLQKQREEILMKNYGMQVSWVSERWKVEYQEYKLKQIQKDLLEVYNSIENKAELKRKCLQLYQKYEKCDNLIPMMPKSALPRYNQKELLEFLNEFEHQKERPHQFYQKPDEKLDPNFKKKEQLERALGQLKLKEDINARLRTKQVERLALEGVILTR